MNEVIIIKYGELSTKSDNINFFIKCLQKNIDNKLKNIKHEIKYDYGRMIIYSSQVENSINLIKEVFGVHEICKGFIFNNESVNDIKEEIINLLQKENFSSFRVTVKRSNKNYPGTSVEIAKDLGAYILKKIPNIHVDIKNSEINVNVEIRQREILLYYNGIKGLGGYPVSCQGKGLLMLSGGIDSPVAGYLAIKRGIKIEAVYFDSPPHTSPMALEKVKKLAQVLAKYNCGEVKIHVINFTKIQEEIIKNIPNYYLITIMRRMMYQISAILANNINAHAIINGESVGQVASQTLQSMQVINEAIKMPVLRPVCTYDKLEIIALARKIGTYDISIEPYEDCCTIFVPDHPVIHPSIKLVNDYEKLVDFKTLIFNAIKSRQTITITDQEVNDYSDLL